MRFDRFWILIFATLPAIIYPDICWSEAKGWEEEKTIAMHRGLIAHTIYNPGMSGKTDIAGKQRGTLSFSYPMGRTVKVYTAGYARDWNRKSNTGGEGIWVLSKTNGVPHVSVAGNRKVTDDVEGLEHDPSSWPEAYLGVVHHGHYALSIRKPDGKEAAWTDGVSVLAETNWWPASGGLDAAPTPISQNEAVFIWNFRYGRYNSRTPFKERISEFTQMSAPTWAEALSEDDFPELVAISRAKSTDAGLQSTDAGLQSTHTGLQWTRKWYQWGHADYDDFLINETVVENTSADRVEGVYILLQNHFLSHFATGYRGDFHRFGDPVSWSRDDHSRSTVAANYLDGVSTQTFLAGGGKPAGSQTGADLAAQGHAMLYAHDGESTHIDNPDLDVGDPFRFALTSDRYKNTQTWIREGMILHGQYFGIGVVDALPPFNTYGGLDPEVYVAPHDNPNTPLNESLNQPASATFGRHLNDRWTYDHPDPENDTDALIYDTFTTTGYSNEPDDAYDYRQFMVFGPYDLNPDEKCKVVVAYVGAHASDAPKYADYKRYAQPFTFSWILLSDGPGREPVSFTERQPEIPLGEAAMFRHFQRAIDVYNWGYDIPNQPPNIKLSIANNVDGQTVLQWSAFGEDSEDPDYTGEEARDLTGYRIYRSITENQGPWEFVTEFSIDDARSGQLPTSARYIPDAVFRTLPNSAFPQGIPLRQSKYHSGADPNAGSEIPGLYTYTDVSSKAGFPAWYSVRFYDSGHADWKSTGTAIPVLESAPGPAGGAVIGATLGIVPLVPGHATFDNLSVRIKVVPNPYRAGDDLHTYNRSRNLRFINLPGRCQIDLYTVSGDLFRTFFNNNSNRGEVTYDQIVGLNRSGVAQGLASGIYFWKVTSLMPGSEGKVQKGTFVVIQ